MIRSHADRSASRAIALSIALLLSIAAPFAAAQDRAAARRHFAAAERHYAASEWPEALAEYQAANLAAPMPEFLFNMAQCHRQLGHAAEAMDLYQRFLLERPDAPNRATVEGLIDEMRAQVSPAQPEPTPPPADTEPAPARSAAAAPEAHGPTSPRHVAPADEQPSTLGRIRVTTWAALGGGVLLLGISGLFALDASDAESDLADPSLSCKTRLPRCLDLQDRGDQSSVLRNTFFALGLATLAGTGVLAYLDLTGGVSSERVAAIVPAVSPHGFGLAGVFTWQ